MELWTRLYGLDPAFESRIVLDSDSVKVEDRPTPSKAPGILLLRQRLGLGLDEYILRLPMRQTCHSFDCLIALF